MRRERCLCGGWIEAESVEVCDGPMFFHVESLTHQIWRGVREGRFPGQREGSTAPRPASRALGSVGALDPDQASASTPAAVRRIA